MKNYSEMSNQEIALRVAQLNEMYEDITFTAHDDYVELGDGANWRKFNPCNNPSDAWSIILDSRITISPITRGVLWQAFVIYGKYEFVDKNPLRAAMIVFLMMKEAGA